jgi:hypothetical protein
MQDSTSYADPCLQMWDTFACATAILLTHFIISIAVLENVPPDAGLQNRATFLSARKADLKKGFQHLVLVLVVLVVLVLVVLVLVVGTRVKKGF